jgi:hypothetical protein
MKKIHLFFILICSSVSYSQLPIPFEKMQEIIHEEKIVYIAEWGIVSSQLYNECLRVRGQFADGMRFIAYFDGYQHKDGKWIANGDAEYCKGEEYCEVGQFGCEKGCEYYGVLKD